MYDDLRRPLTAGQAMVQYGEGRVSAVNTAILVSYMSRWWVTVAISRPRGALYKFTLNCPPFMIYI